MIGAVDAVLHEIGADDVPVELVLNKIDQVDPLGRRRLRTASRFAPDLGGHRRGRGGAALSDRAPLRRPLRGRPAAAAVRGGRQARGAVRAGAPIDEREDSEHGVLVAPAAAARASAASPPISSPTRATRPSAGCQLAGIAGAVQHARRRRDASFSRSASASSSRSRPARSRAGPYRRARRRARRLWPPAARQVPPSSRIAFLTFSAVSPGFPVARARGRRCCSRRRDRTAVARERLNPEKRTLNPYSPPRMMMGAEPWIRVSALLRWGDGILLCRHDKRGRHVWLLPGGGVHSGETLMDALRREIAEEVGIEPPPPKGHRPSTRAPRAPHDEARRPHHLLRARRGDRSRASARPTRQSAATACSRSTSSPASSSTRRFSFLQRWQSGDPAVYLGALWTP